VRCSKEHLHRFMADDLLLIVGSVQAKKAYSRPRKERLHAPRRV
jgi:hypothetical protein